MIGQRELTFEDYEAILRRRLWLLLLPTLLGGAIVFGVSFLLQERYTSQTLVLVEQQKVPESYVKSVVTDQLSERLASMQEQILSRTRLEPVIRKFGLYKADQDTVPMEDLVDRLRKSIEVAPVRATSMSASSTGGLPGFYIALTADSPRLAQQICSEITSMFMEQNLKDREKRAEGTTDFVSKQLEEAERNLNEQDAKLAAFKSKFGGTLPTEDQGNLNILMGLNTRLDTANQTIARAQQDKVYLSAQLDQAIAAWRASMTSQGGVGDPSALQHQMDQKQNELITLESHYTSDHPDVIKLKHDISELQKKIDDAAAAAAKAAKEKPDDKSAKPAVQEPSPIPQYRAQIYQLDQTIRERTQEQARLQKEIQQYQARMQMTPMVEQQYEQLTRDHATALAFYNNLLAKKKEAEEATDLERRQEGEQFVVMDPANLPEKPSFPNRILFGAGGLGGGLSLGLALALLLELKDKGIRSERDVEALLGLPTLAMVPTVTSGNGKKPRFWKRGGPKTPPKELQVGA